MKYSFQAGKKQLKYRTLGRTGLEVSEIGLGALEVGRPWGIGDYEGDQGLPPDEAEAERFLNSVLDNGVNFLDSASAYWASEERIGKYLSARRDEFILASKWGEWCDASGSVYNYSPQEFWKFLESSLTKLRTDCIDLYQIHSGPMDVINNTDVIQQMKQAQQQGKIRFMGVSCGIPEARAAILSGAFDTIQISYSLIDRTAEIDILPLAKANNIGVIVKDGLGSGRLTPKYKRWAGIEDQTVSRGAALEQLGSEFGMSLVELALRYVLSQPAVSTIITGTRSTEHLVENIRAVSGGALPEDLQDLAAQKAV